MSRHGYSEDCDDTWGMIRYAGAVKSAIRGKRGQAFLRELATALDAMPEKALIAEELAKDGEVCALGCVGHARGIDMSETDPEDAERVAKLFGISETLAREIMYWNDGVGCYRSSDETPERRWKRVRSAVETRIVCTDPVKETRSE